MSESGYEPKRDTLERWCTETGTAYVPEEWAWNMTCVCWEKAGDPPTRVTAAGTPWRGAAE